MNRGMGEPGKRGVDGIYVSKWPSTTFNQRHSGQSASDDPESSRLCLLVIANHHPCEAIPVTIKAMFFITKLTEKTFEI